MKYKVFLLHSFLFPLYFVLFFWSKNLSISFLEVWPPLIFFFSFAIGAVLVLGFILRNFKKAGLIVSLFFILFFSYGHTRSILGNLKLFGIEVGRHTYLMIIWVFILVIVSIVIIMLRNEKVVNGLTTCLNLMGLLLMVFVLFPILIFQIKNLTFKKENIIMEKAVTDNTVKLLSQQMKNNSLPDIYYIILDSYMNSDILKSELDFDNSEFCEWLQKKGFFVSSSSRSNYVWTYLSLPSSLNFRYLDNIKDKNKEGELLYNNKVAEILKKRGYKVISISTSGIAINDDLRFQYGPAKDFLPSLIENTWIYPFTFFGLFNSILYEYQRKCILYGFEKLNEIPNIKEPTFTFAHINNPHPPYIFNKEGKPLNFNLFNLSNFRALKNNKKRGELWHKIECTLYIGQVIFLNKKVEFLINKILSSSPDSIIIIQGDHGQFLGLPDIPSKKIFKLRTSIFNAYYLPNLKSNPLYHGISPVNSFRIVFNSYFGENYELLPDISYWSSGKIWDFIVVEKEEQN